jgi:hypothetical protein
MREVGFLFFMYLINICIFAILQILARYLKIKESKAFDYQMYPEIFVDLSIWQEIARSRRPMKR